MSPAARRLSLGITAASLLGAAAWAATPAEYVPVVSDRRQRLVEDPALRTPQHLDRLEAVLRRYGEWYERRGAARLRISRSLWLDRELLWNYTSKAEEDRPADNQPLQRTGDAG